MTGGFAGIRLDVVAGGAVAAGAWVGAWLGRGVRPRPGETVAFAGALVTILAVLNGPLHALSDRYLFSAHMVQHLALTLAVPPLLLVGTPAFMVDGLLQGRTAARLARVLTRPVPALGLYSIALVGWHLPGPYGVALGIHAWHVVQDLTLGVTAQSADSIRSSPTTI